MMSQRQFDALVEFVYAAANVKSNSDLEWAEILKSVAEDEIVFHPEPQPKEPHMELLTCIARLVQGSMTLQTKNDMQTGKPKLDEHGQPIKECFFAIAIEKTNPRVNELFAAMTATARAEFPHLFDAAGNCTHPQFAWKFQDGDGKDTTGKSVGDKAGFAGHWIFKLATRYPPKCYRAGAYDPAQQLQDPDSIIKRGHFVRVNINIAGNGVKADDRVNKPGLYLSPNLVEWVAFGPEITSGPDASKVLGAAPVAAEALPAGASATPVGAPAASGVPGAALAPPPMPGAASGPPVGAAPPLPPAAAVAGPPIPGAVAAPPPPPPVQQGKVMLPAALGASYEAMIAAGWTDAALIQHGMMAP
jgi:hypothetical protein